MTHRILIFSLILCVFIFGCSNKDMVDNDDLLDTSPPSLIINDPTTEISFVTTGNSINISGIAYDDVSIENIQWVSSAQCQGYALGLEEWSISDISLAEGDNSITVTARDKAGNAGSDVITITKNEYITFLGRPSADPSGLYTSMEGDVRIRASIAPNPDLVQSSVTLVEVDEANNIIDELVMLYDNGSLGYGDDIQGDGVFSTIYSFYSDTPRDIRLRIRAETQEISGLVEGYSAVFIIKIVQQISEETVNQVISAQQDGSAQYEQLCESMDPESAKEATVELLKQSDMISAAGISSSGDIWIEYSVGLSGFILTGDELVDGGDVGRAKKPSIPLSEQSRGTLDYNPGSIAEEDPDAVQNKNAFLFMPFFTENTEMGDQFDYSVELNTLLSNSKYPKFDILYLQNGACTVNQLQNLTQYGLIAMHTHGGVIQGNVVFLTGEEVTEETRETHMIDWIAGRLTVGSHGDINYWAVNPSFIENLSGTFPNSIVYNGSCQSDFNTTMRNAFLGKGCNTYFGWSNTVFRDFNCSTANSLFEELIVNHENAGDAFDALEERCDSHDEPACLELSGNRDTYFDVSLINGDFESGDLKGWIKDGDGRVITQLGFLSPTQGSYMGIISTGLGMTLNMGSIKQSFFIEEGMTKLTVKWNFISEEFEEYVGSIFQDYFTIILISESGSSNTLFYKSIDNIAGEYALIDVSPQIVFDQGDVYMTGWQTFTFDISGYAGEGVTIILKSGDIGDSIYDTAILLDEISVE